MDQAIGLRNRASYSDTTQETANKNLNYDSTTTSPLRVFAITSGKGGVGKSNIVINLALAFDQMGKNVLIIDGDLGLANIDVLLGLTPKYNIHHVFEGVRTINDILLDGPGNIKIMPASSGVQELAELQDEQKLFLMEMLEVLEENIDVLLIDTGAGISDNVIYFNLAAQEKIVVITPEPTSLTDAYAMIKVLHTRYGEKHFRILVNLVKDNREALNIYNQISKVADNFLDGLSLDYLGYVPKEHNLPRAVMKQQAMLHLYPDSPASQVFPTLAKRLQVTKPGKSDGNIRFFRHRLFSLG
ncbi:MAG TPA: flagellar synthesis regulator FleN [Deltaproteobacteria bacterium]|nr:flagellar synthesis regulator FleN [Deltaproteobacteria bacterium]